MALGVRPAEAARPRGCAPTRIIVVDDNDQEIESYLDGGDVGVEFNVTPRLHRWRRDRFVVRNAVDPAWDAGVAEGVAILDADLTKRTVGFASGGGTKPRNGEIVIVHDPSLLDDNYLGMAWYWVRDADREAIIAAKIVMAVGPDDWAFIPTLIHELGHAVGLGHESRVDENGDAVAVMHPFIGSFVDYQPDDLNGLARLRYRTSAAERRRVRRLRRRKKRRNRRKRG